MRKQFCLAGWVNIYEEPRSRAKSKEPDVFSDVPDFLHSQERTAIPEKCAMRRANDGSCVGHRHPAGGGQDKPAAPEGLGSPAEDSGFELGPLPEDGLFRKLHGCA